MSVNHAPLYQVTEELARQHADAYTKEWQHTSPDLVVFIPEADKGPETDNQHFIVFPLKNGDFFAVWTTGYREGHANQHILFNKSKDRGVTWTKPVTLGASELIERDGKQLYKEGAGAWAFPIYVPDKNRIYIFYKEKGDMCFIFTEDDGETWSDKYTVPLRRTAITAPDAPSGWLIWQHPVEITPGQILGCGTIWGTRDISSSTPHHLPDSECWFWRFDNIITEDDPTKIRVTTLPDGDYGIRMPHTLGAEGTTAEEPTVVRLSDGRWFCVLRTFLGYIGYSTSDDEGHTWSEAKPMLYYDGGPPILEPVAPCPIYALSDGRFFLTFHNNDGTANGGKDPWDWRRNRNPAFYSLGKEMLDKEQPVWFSPPIKFLDNEAMSWGPVERRSVAIYTSFFEFEGKRWYWYPDRKHFLLGKFITDQMLEDAEKLWDTQER